MFHLPVKVSEKHVPFNVVKTPPLQSMGIKHCVIWNHFRVSICRGTNCHWNWRNNSFSVPWHVLSRVIQELLVQQHLARYTRAYKYDPVFALGFVTVYDQLMDGYPKADQREPIFKAYIRKPHSSQTPAIALVLATVCMPVSLPESMPGSSLSLHATVCKQIKGSQPESLAVEAEPESTRPRYTRSSICTRKSRCSGVYGRGRDA